jgi:hypothetical protein
MFAALVSFYCATIACAEETALNLVPREKYWFAVPPPKVDVRAYGVSFAVSCDKCTWSDTIDFTLYRIDKQTEEKCEVSEVFKTRICPRDLGELRFYNVFFFKDLVETYSAQMQMKNFLDAAKGKQFLVTLTASAPMRFHFEGAISKTELIIEGPADLFPGKTRGNIELYTNGLIRLIPDPFFYGHTGLPVSGLESPVPDILALLAGIALICLVIILILFVALGRMVFSERWRKLAVLVVGTSSVIYILYFITAAPEFLAGDALEMQIGQYLYKDLHQPGYPLSLLLGHLYQKIFPFGNFMYIANHFAATCSAIGVGFFAGALYLFSKKRILSILLALCLGTTLTYWNYAVVAQSYSMSSCLLGLAFFGYFLFCAVRNRRTFLFFGLICFLCPIAHMTSIALAFLLALLSVRKSLDLPSPVRNYIYLGCMCVIAFLILYIPLAVIEAPTQYERVLYFLDGSKNPVSVKDDYKMVMLDLDHLKAFLEYIRGNKGGSSWIQGVGGHMLSSPLAVLKASKDVYFKPLFWGFGFSFTLLGFVGLFVLLKEKASRLLGTVLALSILFNMFFNYAEEAHFNIGVGFLNYVTVHQFPSFFTLAFVSIGVCFLRRQPINGSISNQISL